MPAQLKTYNNEIIYSDRLACYQFSLLPFTFVTYSNNYNPNRSTK